MAKKALIEKHKKGNKFGVREYNRCPICGNPRGYYRRFKMCRKCFRELAHKGELPGVKKSSW
ncbi:type Z 30S ribosomal protein S14 [candidate division WWE3 bacterium]|uniref:Small ribosomal subunit protein uS14 n=1 Tax=candidate division WWE3 bacterium TaxID=2053526 RepID=A0A3A4ZAP8_UNCKA|nr:MAG: type Z 30S ribosomal protein S14 [candidate division WWE3 bacterium]